jgi:hypothetical protein
MEFRHPVFVFHNISTVSIGSLLYESKTTLGISTVLAILAFQVSTFLKGYLMNW